MKTENGLIMLVFAFGCFALGAMGYHIAHIAQTAKISTLEKVCVRATVDLTK